MSAGNAHIACQREINRKHGGDIMAEKVQDYREYDSEREEGHVDTRAANFECENKDEHLGCDPGIDVAG
jgi:hypothetical protein